MAIQRYTFPHSAQTDKVRFLVQKCVFFERFLTAYSYSQSPFPYLANNPSQLFMKKFSLPSRCLLWSFCHIQNICKGTFSLHLHVSADKQCLLSVESCISSAALCIQQQYAAYCIIPKCDGYKPRILLNNPFHNTRLLFTVNASKTANRIIPIKNVRYSNCWTSNTRSY